MGSCLLRRRNAVIFLAFLMAPISLRADSPTTAQEVAETPDLVARLRAATGQDSGDLRADIRTAVKLAKIIPQVNFDKIPLEKALDPLQKATGADFRVEWNALEASGIKRDTEVSLKLTNASGERTLRHLLNQAAGKEGVLTFALNEGIVIVSTPESFNVRKFTRSYDIRDLLPPSAAEKTVQIEPPPSFDGSADQPDQSQTGTVGPVVRSGQGRYSIFGGQGDQGGQFGQGGPQDEQDQFDRRVKALIELIRNSVMPDSWAPTGDSILREMDGRLLVKTTFDGHLAVAGFLALLPRRPLAEKPVEDRQVLLDARLLFVEPEAARKLDLPGEGKSAFLDHQRAAALLKALLDDPRTIVAASPRLAIPVGGSTNMMVTTPHEYTSWYSPNAEDADIYDATSATVHEGVIFWAAALGVSPDGGVSLKLQPTIQVLDRFDDLPAPGVPARRKLTIQRPVTRRLQLNISASVPDGQTAVLGGAMFIPAQAIDADARVASTEPFQMPSKPRAVPEHMFIMFVRPRVAYPAATTQPGAGRAGDGHTAGGTVSIDITDADQPQAGKAADAAEAYQAASKKLPPIPGADAFAADLYRQLAGKNDGNILFSPVSIQTALAMTYAGAAGDTANQMAAACHFSPKDPRNINGDPLPEQTQVDFRDLLTALNNPRWGPRGNPVYKLTIANALWAQKNYPFKATFTDLVKKNFQAELANMDFVQDHDGATRRINEWVSRQTKGKITDIIKPNSLTDLTRLVLTNAVYFKGTWMSRFKVTDTAPGPFTLAGGKKVQTPFMNQTEKFGYMQNEDFQALSMNYLGGDLSMIVLLPRKVDGLKGLEKIITGENLTKWAYQMEKQEVVVSLPRFKFTNEFSMNDVLTAMGMADAFDPKKADFSGMASPADTHEPPLYIDKVLHNAFVAVDEEGTEAAAATAVIMSAGGISEPTTFTADHPFIFLIRHNASDGILFLGRVTDPRAE